MTNKTMYYIYLNPQLDNRQWKEWMKIWIWIPFIVPNNEYEMILAVHKIFEWNDIKQALVIKFNSMSCSKISHGTLRQAVRL